LYSVQISFEDGLFLGWNLAGRGRSDCHWWQRHFYCYANKHWKLPSFAGCGML